MVLDVLTRADELEGLLRESIDSIWPAVDDADDLAAAAAAAGASTLTHSDGYFGVDDDDDVINGAGVIVRIDVGVVRIFDGNGDGDDDVIDTAAASAA